MDRLNTSLTPVLLEMTTSYVFSADFKGIKKKSDKIGILYWHLNVMFTSVMQPMMELVFEYIGNCTQ